MEQLDQLSFVITNEDFSDAITYNAGPIEQRQVKGGISYQHTK